MALQALRRLFPNFDEEAKSTDGRWAQFTSSSIWLRKSYNKTYLRSILAGSFNFHTHGGTLFCPTVDQCTSNSQEIENFFMSRDAYERLLRGLVRKSSKRIKWISGTAIGVKTAPSDTSRVESVTIRTSNGIEEIPGTLVVGG